MRQIEAAALELLVEKGYSNISMLQIAKKACASNQTLYAWYGNKAKLFQSLIEAHSKKMKEAFNEASNSGGDPLAVLQIIGPMLLEFVTSKEAIIVNRAAITDSTDSGLLAQAIDLGVRQEVLGIIEAIFDKCIAKERLTPDTCAMDATETYISLLFGEVQIRQAFGLVGMLSAQEVQTRADRAFKLTMKIYRNGA